MDSKLKIPPEIIDGSDTPEEYHFSNPGPTDPAEAQFLDRMKTDISM